MKPATIRLLSLLSLVVLTAGTAQARLGETLAELKKRYGSPLGQLRKDDSTATWSFEGENGALLYTVTFNAKGHSIGEGLKPYKRARFSEDTALDFIKEQMADYEDSKTMRILKPGEKCQFAKQEFVCGQDEYVAVDEPQGVLLIWSKVANPAVMVVSPAMFQRGAGK